MGDSIFAAAVAHEACPRNQLDRETDGNFLFMTHTRQNEVVGRKKKLSKIKGTDLMGHERTVQQKVKKKETREKLEGLPQSRVLPCVCVSLALYVQSRASMVSWWRRQQQQHWHLMSQHPHAPSVRLAPRLLLEHVNCVIVFHVQARRSICLVDGLAVEAEPHVLDAQARSVAVGSHELSKRRVLFDFEVDDASVLTNNF